MQTAFTNWLVISFCILIYVDTYLRRRREHNCFKNIIKLPAYEDLVLVRCNTMLLDRKAPTLQMNLLPPPSWHKAVVLLVNGPAASSQILVHTY
jgi:hypothetical protein